MSNTLVCLTSNQRMQNVLPLYQRGMNFDHVVLLVSSDRGNPEVFADFFHSIAKIMKHAGIRPEENISIWPTPVNPVNIEDVRSTINDVVKDASKNKCSITINYTGGTKQMAIGAYLAGLDTGANLLYVDTGASEFIANSEIISFNLQNISIEDILKLHGRDINKAKTKTDLLTGYQLEISQRIFNNCSKRLLDCRNIRREFLTQKSIAERDKNKKPISFSETLVNRYQWFFNPLILAKLVTPHENIFILGTKAYKFIDGGWLEGYTYLLIKNSNHYSEVFGNLHIKGISNELDVCFSYEGKFGIIECKAGDLAKVTGRNAINRLDSLRDSVGGIFSKGYLVHLDPIDENSALYIRATSYRLKMIGPEKLTSLENIIYQDMTRKQ